MSNIKLFLMYILTGTLFTVLYGEIIPVFIADNTIFLDFWVVITLYYIFTTFVFSLFIFRIPPLFVIIAFFFYGTIMEMFVFRNIHGLMDFLGILFFGNQYIALFGIPYLITKRLFPLLKHEKAVVLKV